MLILIALLFLGSSSARPAGDEGSSCGYASCHPVKEGMINVHIVPHTHDDVGWLKTVDQYYWGSRTNIQDAGVQYILDSVVKSLREDPARKFIYVETAFFWKWWIKQHDTVKSLVRKFVNNGQLEFIGGGWSMNDEAASHYHSTIDQLTWGLRKLNDTFGECGRPKIGWQIDPFGHSREQASIFAQLGYDGLLLGRIDYQEKTERFNTRTPEMVWRGSASLGKKSEIFTGIMYNVYAYPKGFCFDVLCTDDPIIDDKKSPDYNVNKRIDDFFAYLDNVTQVYTTNNVIITMGEDFTYQDANKWFKNLDKLIKYANERQASGSKYNLIYSTPSCYVKAIYDETKGKKAWPVKEDDFFPYASDPHAFWTGYFTSRPTSKRFEREGNNFLQVCKQLYALTDLDPIDWVDLNVMREAMGVMQHHDAITGTEKQHVADDYHRILQDGFNECQFVTATALSKLAAPTESFAKGINDEPVPTIDFQSCLLSNISSCPLAETEKDFIVTVYNPLSRPVSKYVRLPVLGSAYQVKDIDGKELKVQLMPIPDSVQKIPGRISEATVELVFRAENLHPLGFKSYYISRTSGSKVLKPVIIKDEYKTESVSIKLGTNGLLQEVTANGVTVPVNQNFYYYKGFVGDNKEFNNRSSGAYIFRPLKNSLTKVADKAETKVFQDEISLEIHQIFNDWVSQIIRVYNKENYVEFDWLVGPIPTDAEENGKEIITKFETGLNSDGVFYTDSNGREMLQRIRNFRPTWNLKLEEPESGNYYPVTSKITLKDSNKDIQVSVLNDRAQGGSSLQDGNIELMIHRRCLHDDSFGVGEALMEEAFGSGLVARGSHFLIIGPVTNKTSIKSTVAQERDLAQRNILKPWTFVSKTQGLNFDQYKAKYFMEYFGLKKALPDNVQILTLEPWKGFDFLLRLEHVFEANEDVELSQPVSVNVKNLFAAFEIDSIEETTLGANQWLKDSSPLDFDIGDEIENFISTKNLSPEEVQNRIKYSNKINDSLSMTKRATLIEAPQDDMTISLSPMEIRTFIIKIQKIN